ncbi:MAG: hypothetical protein CMF22_02715 [Idiomarinaceae bacterium]|nr:hypothetical protein [Idiomarinaceae bacterium]|tara:strand:- start:1620 stop:1865 length:246 start_codon:yes stop_codon:yes gene_type:complete
MHRVVLSSHQRCRGFLLWEWVIALTLLGCFAVFVIALLQQQKSLVEQQAEWRRELRLATLQREIDTFVAGHTLLFDLQEGY